MTLHVCPVCGSTMTGTRYEPMESWAAHVWTCDDPDRHAKRLHEKTCPECRQGKHPNCTGLTIDQGTDETVPCACTAGV